MKYYLMAYVSYDWELMPGFAEDLFGENEFDSLDFAINEMLSLLEWYKKYDSGKLSRFKCFEVCGYDPELLDDSGDFPSNYFLVKYNNDEFKVVFDSRLS